MTCYGILDIRPVFAQLLRAHTRGRGARLGGQLLRRVLAAHAHGDGDIRVARARRARPQPPPPPPPPLRLLPQTRTAA
jgi:hypothetical protein